MTELRVGIGHDTHRLTDGQAIRIGGIEIPHDRTAVGHSDADVLLHAVTDALLGAVAMGDIGQRFPDTDPANRGRDSGEMLRAVWTEVAQAGWSVVNLDMIVFAERPKLAPHAVAIRHRIAELLDTTPDRVGLKAKTGEGLAPIGTEEAIGAECVVLLEKS